MCVETTKIRHFEHMKKNVIIEYTKNDFSMVQFGQNFHFFLVCYFLIFYGIKMKVPKHQSK